MRSTTAVLAAVARACASAAIMAASTALAAAAAVAPKSAVARSNGDFVFWTVTFARSAATFAGSAGNLRRSAGAEAARFCSGVEGDSHKGKDADQLTIPQKGVSAKAGNRLFTPPSTYD